MRTDEVLVYILPMAVVALVTISIWRRRPGVVGKRGERRVARVLSTLDQAQFRVLNDILIQSARGSSQIDHVVVSSHGIFVIETKCLRGWIHGSERASTWTQSIYRYKQRFLNPILQNMSHVCVLRELVDTRGVPIYPIVVFAGSGELKNVKVTSPVIYLNELAALIENTGKAHLSNEQVESLFGKIQRLHVAGRFARKQHVQNVRTTKLQRVARLAEISCPRCGGKLVPRRGKYGNFFGCMNYPQCRFTEKAAVSVGA